jgi:hypothetical protein
VLSKDIFWFENARNFKLYNRLKPMAKFDIDTLQAALVGYQHQLDQFTAKIEEIRRQIAGGPAGSAPPAPATTRRTMSAAARKRTAAAQRARWQAYHAEHGQPKRPAGKRKLSPEGRARIIAALKKRWASKKSALRSRRGSR